MIKVTLLAVGSLKEQWWRGAQEEYRKRMTPYAKLDIIEVEPLSVTATVTATKAMDTEAERLIKRIPNGALVVALDRTGKEWTSEETAAFLDQVRSEGREVAFIIGGSDGIGAKALAMAQRKWSLSKLTFPHEMARAIVLEQLYRGFCINAGKPYHK